MEETLEGQTETFELVVDDITGELANLFKHHSLEIVKEQFDKTIALFDSFPGKLYVNEIYVLGESSYEPIFKHKFAPRVFIQVCTDDKEAPAIFISEIHTIYREEFQTTTDKIKAMHFKVEEASQLVSSLNKESPWNFLIVFQD